MLLHDPGAAWTYGVNLDWLGRIVEKVRDKRLGDVMKVRLFEPLGMTEIGFRMTDAMKARRAVIHDRAADGKLTPLSDLVLPDPPPMDMGGHGLYATVGEHMKFIRMVLNGGAGANGRVLKARDGGGDVARRAEGAGARRRRLDDVDPVDQQQRRVLPWCAEGLGLHFHGQPRAHAVGPQPGSLMWGGLANSFYWIDRSAGIGGSWASQVLPFQDISSYPAFVEFETTVYRYR